MNILGISAGFHDAAATLIKDEEIIFAGHAERYSKRKHDSRLNSELIQDAIKDHIPDMIAYYERPWVKKARQIYAGQWGDLYRGWSAKYYLKYVAPELLHLPIKTYNHHKSHAAAGFQTSPFQTATVVVIDAIGEWDTISIWSASYDKKGYAKYDQVWRQVYPHSIGLMYSAFTKEVGLKPLDEEYILMGMSAYGNGYKHLRELREWLIQDEMTLSFKHNLHLGLPSEYLNNPEDQDRYDVAAAAQTIVEDLIYSVMTKARSERYNLSSNLVYMGGVALNCLANRDLGEYFDNMWIMPNPGDAGSSLGAAALAYGKQLHWQDAYLGHNIPGPYPVQDIISELITNKIVGVANGRAEFGPRALGNRSLLADPRGYEIKDKVNEIKRRQKFRPFAPVILEEYANEYFVMPKGFESSPYMQAVAMCSRPTEFPAIIHADGSSRVQTVSKDCKSGIRQLLEAWHVWTGCPMLLNTSLNIRGEPMVNDRVDADRFENLYGIKVFS